MNIIFDVINLFFILISNCSLIYKNTINSYILTLYPVILPNLFIHFSILFWGGHILCYFLCRQTLIKTVLYFPFAFSKFITLARPSNTILHRSGPWSTLVLFLILVVEHSVFQH